MWLYYEDEHHVYVMMPKVPLAMVDGEVGSSSNIVRMLAPSGDGSWFWCRS